MGFWGLFAIVVGTVAGVITIPWGIHTYVWPKLIRPAILRLFNKTQPNDPAMPATEKTSQSIDARLERIETRLGQFADYLDGLPDTKDKKKHVLFTRGREAQKAYQYTEAIKLFNEILSMETSGSERVALHGLIGNCFMNMSELKEAEGHYKEAEAEAKAADDTEGLAAAMGNLGIVYRQKGELDKAMEHHQQALKIDIEIGNRLGQANQLGNLGIVYTQKGELDRALDNLLQALEIDREIGYRIGEANQLGNLGIVYQQKGKLDKALEHLHQALQISQQIGARPEAEKAKRNIEVVLEARGEK
jgi:tetratricopeptide (TPR) repeat protein